MIAPLKTNRLTALVLILIGALATVIHAQTPVTITGCNAEAGYQTPCENAIDGDPDSRFTILANGSYSNSYLQVMFDNAEISQIRLRMYRYTSRSYPLQVEAGSNQVFYGNTSIGTEWFEINFSPITSRVSDVGVYKFML